MSFIVEDGSGKADATSYVDDTDFAAFHTDRAVDTSAWDSAAQQAALIRATDYVDKRFGRRFRGSKSTSGQALEWPRSDAYDDDDYALDNVPAQLKNAICEYALLALQLSRNLAPLPAVSFGVVDPATGTVTNQTSGQVSSKAESVGPISTSTGFASASEGRPMTSSGNLIQQLPDYPQADLWLEELLRSSSARTLSRG